MRRLFLIFGVASILLTGSLAAQDTLVRGGVTYIGPDAVYASIGRSSGIADSSILLIRSGGDTIAVLKVFAVSSKSSVSHILHSTRPPRIGDQVEASVKIQGQPAPTATVTDTATRLMRRMGTESPSIRSQGGRPAITLGGRASIQYLRTTQPSYGRTITQPGLVLNLRGAARDIPLRFELSGNIRSMVYGKQLFFSSDQTNRSRIYRMFIEYDDTTNRITFGRFVPPGAMTTGYTDGVMFSRTEGFLTLGTSAGFEPSFAQQGLSTDMKKFSLFALVNAPDFMRMSANLSYTKRYDHTAVDREVVSSGIMMTPSPDLFITVQGDIDLRQPSGGELRSKAALTSLNAMVNERIIPELSVGAGVSAWRPVYSYASIAGIPDSLLDHQIQTTPSVSFTINLPRGVSMTSMYSPRSSANGFGSEYNASSALSAWNLAGSGFSVRGTYTRNLTPFTVLQGYGASLGRSFGRFGDATFRYQGYHYDYRQIDMSYNSSTLGLDGLVAVTSSLSLSGSVERMIGPGMDGYNIFAELSVRW
jgi:hypothetical protein